METEERTHTRWPLPPRSAADRKLGGVAGGLGRAWRVDPILIRVAFVVLTVFGGSGVTLYCAGWLLMRGDGDDASAIEALAGRGRSSVSPALTVVLIVVGLVSMGSVFSWGFPFWPVLIGAIVLVALLSHQRGAGHPGWPGHQGRRDAGSWTDNVADRASRWGHEVGERAARWGNEFGERADGWFGHGCGQRPSSSTEADGGRASRTGTEREPSRVQATEVDATETTTAEPAADGPAAPPEPEDLLTDGRTPPAWDPLGAAPFAWDLPDPTAPQPSAADADSNPRRGSRPGGAIARIFLGLALIVGSLLTAGVVTERVSLSWSAVAGITLGVLALGMLIAALRGRGARLLIGPGVFLAVLTLALTVTGLQGTGGIGGHTWAPTSTDDVLPQYFWNAGDATLDLSGLHVPVGATVGTAITVGAGQATVILPSGVTVQAQCSATAGDIDCLGQRADGLRPQASVTRPGNSDTGTLDITVHSNAGQAVLISHE